MKTHHLNCMSFREMNLPEIAHVLLIETKDKLVLVDSGLGLDDFDRPSRVEWLAMRFGGLRAAPNETPLRQVSRLGYDPHDVRHIVPTHLHFDHIGGALDFPWATVHAWEVEIAAGLHPRSWRGFFGYLPSRWKGHLGLKVYTLCDERWFDLAAMPVIQRVDVEIWLVPLVGHSPAMCGIAVKCDNNWLWHCGDAYVRQMQVDPAGPGTAFPRFARRIEDSMFPVAAREKIRTVLADHGDKIVAFCSHDPEVFYKMVEGSCSV